MLVEGATRAPVNRKGQTPKDLPFSCRGMIVLEFLYFFGGRRRIMARIIPRMAIPAVG
ncbi:MAG: hypothetical protein A4E62_02629 [Syntrophorhabdus sp. PtaU1.Bin002]|nr:MAG: hypothetical protein A4E62_02629 [Syntrophorhabdus sp. PtaU1.Bin002]